MHARMSVLMSRGEFSPMDEIERLHQKTASTAVDLAEKLDAVEAWKAEALLVLAQWDRVGKAIIARFGVEPRIGESIPRWCERIIRTRTPDKRTSLAEPNP
jgi:hypothetical protein